MTNIATKLNIYNSLSRKKQQKLYTFKGNTEKRGRELVATPLLTFQLFIYESLSIQFHNSVKRTRDVVPYVFYLCFIIKTNSPEKLHKDLR